MRAKSTRIILLTGYPEVENPGGIIAPGASSIVRNARSERTLIWNMDHGTVEINRSILWDVQAEDGPELTNYVEIPLRHNVMWRADPDNPLYPYAIQFSGIVRIWESGTLQFIGDGVAYPHSGSPAPAITELSYKVWSGGSPGQLHTVFTLPIDSTTYAVNWSEQAAPGEHWEICYGKMPDDISTNLSAELIAYPDGLVLPQDLWGGSAFPLVGHTGASLTRDGNDIDCSYAVVGAPFTSGHIIYSWLLDSSGFSLSDPILHLAQSTLFPSSFSGSFSREIPDSSTVGLWLQMQTSYSASTHISETFEIGPFFRTAHAPAIQQGVDPFP